MESVSDELERQPSTIEEPLRDAPSASAAVARPTLTSLVRRTVGLGVRCVSYIFAPLIVFGGVLHLGTACWTAAADGGWNGFLEPAFLRAVFRNFGLGVLFGSLLLLLWTVIPCVVVAVIAWMLQRAVPASSRDTTWGRWVLGEAPASGGGEPVVRRSRRRVWRWLILIPTTAALAIIGTAMIGLEFARLRVAMRLNAVIAETALHDPNWQSDLVIKDRPPVPDQGNSAWVVQDVAATLPDSWYVGGGPYPNDAPVAKTDVFVALNRVLKTSDETALDEDLVEFLRAELAEAGEAVVTARTLADSGRGRHELETLFESDESAPPESESARAVAVLLFADATLLAHDGRLAEAANSCRAILGAARSIGDEPSPNAQRLRASIDDWAAQAARRIVGQGEPPDVALVRLQMDLESESSHRLAFYSLRGRRAILDAAIRRIRDRSARLSDFMTGSSFTAFYSDEIRAPWASVLLDNQRAAAIEWMNELMAACRLDGPARADRLSALKAQIDGARETRVGGPFTRLWEDGTVLPRIYIPDYLEEEEGFTRIHSKLKATALLIAFERHRRKHGDWPASIDALDPDKSFGGHDDPFTGRPFLVERRAGGVVIYSVGPNLKDEHGVFDPESRANRPDDFPAQGWDVPLRRRRAGGSSAEAI